MCITQYSNSTRLHHHGKRKPHIPLHPPLGEGAKDVTMSNYKDIRGSATVHKRLLNLLDVADESIESLLYLDW